MDDGLIYIKPKSPEIRAELIWHLENALNLSAKTGDRQLATLNGTPILLNHIGKRFNNDVYICLSMGILDAQLIEQAVHEDYQD